MITLAQEAKQLVSNYEERRAKALQRFGDALEDYLTDQVLRRAERGKRCLRVNFQRVDIAVILPQPELEKFRLPEEWDLLEDRLLQWATLEGLNWRRKEEDPWRVKLSW